MVAVDIAWGRNRNARDARLQSTGAFEVEGVHGFDDEVSMVAVGELVTCRDVWLPTSALFVYRLIALVNPVGDCAGARIPSEVRLAASAVPRPHQQEEDTDSTSVSKRIEACHLQGKPVPRLFPPV
jgi:hypothetical protein